jgi:hypothetical protein
LLQQNGGHLLSRRWARPAQQIVVSWSWRLGFPPAPANVKPPAAGQVHHGMVVAAIAQGLAQGRLRFAEGHEGIQLAHFFEKLLQLGLSH